MTASDFHKSPRGEAHGGRFGSRLTQEEPVRVYVHPTSRSTLTTGIGPPKLRVSRHDVVIIMGIDAHSCFGLEASGHMCITNAVALMPNTRHSVHTRSRPLIYLNVPLIHPRFKRVCAALKQAVVPLHRAAFEHLEDLLWSAYFGHLDAADGGDLMDDILDTLLVGTKNTRPLDPRIRSALRMLGSDIDFPFTRMAKELNLSPSRLSHLFAEQLGLSMRGCQAWGRMARAWEMVVWHRELNFTDIAHIMRFSDSSHLSRAFKGAYGLPPSGFRNDALLKVIGQPLARRAPSGP